MYRLDDYDETDPLFAPETQASAADGQYRERRNGPKTWVVEGQSYTVQDLVDKGFTRDTARRRLNSAKTRAALFEPVLTPSQRGQRGASRSSWRRIR